MNPEWFALASERLFETGALDVTLVPVIMKKGRPGIIVSVLCLPSLKKRLLPVLFEETTTLGVRAYEVERFELKRELKKVKTPFGMVLVKIGKDDSGRVINMAPEYESCKALAKKTGVSLKKIYATALAPMK